MIATIICGVLILLCIAGIIIFFDNEKITRLSLGVITVLVMILAVALGTGRSISKVNTEKYFLEKEHIEYMLENKPDLYIIEQAKSYNHKIQIGNNYWCRFNIEDRSAYLIDIEKYIKGGTKNA